MKTFAIFIFTFAFTLSAIEPDTARAKRIADRLALVQVEKTAVKMKSWVEWFDSLDPFYKNLKEFDRKNAPSFLRTSSNSSTYTLELWPGSGTPTIYAHRLYLIPTFSLTSLPMTKWFEDHNHVSAVVAVDRWLRQQNIKLLFLPVPGMPDVYPDNLFGKVQGFPASGGIQPQIRKMICDLLANDVEVVDLLPDILRAKTEPGFYFYPPIDDHWSVAGRHMAAKRIAPIIKSDSVIASTEKGNPIFKLQTESYDEGSNYAEWLRPDELEAFKTQGHPVRPLPRVHSIDGSAFKPATVSKVLIMGNSFVPGLTPFLSYELNTPVAQFFIPNSTVGSIRDLARDPEMLRNVRWVVWVMDYARFSSSDWEALPASIAKLGANAIPLHY